MQLYLLIALGGALGSVLRFFLSSLVATHVTQTFPLGTLIVNVTGSFAIGFIAALTGPGGRWFLGVDTRLFLMAGICGGYTTFSAFSIQTLNLARDGDWLKAGANVVGSVVLCLVAVWLGHALASNLNASR